MDQMQELDPNLLKTFRLLRYTPRKPQLDIHRALIDNRFAVAVAHRRLGKTVAAVVHLFYRALFTRLPNTQCFYIAPTVAAATRIAWPYAERFAEMLPGVVVRQLDKKVIFPNGAFIQLLGSDRADAIRGIYADACVLDEFAFSKPVAWTAVIRPALSDRRGGALFISTVNGKNLFYRLYEHGKKTPDWASLMFKASETKILPPDELRDALAAMGQEDYDREYECSFDTPPKNSVYGRQIIQILSGEGRLREPHYDTPMEVWLGLNNSDSMAAWLVQFVDDDPIIVDSVEMHGEEFIEILSKLMHWRELYDIAGVIVPATAIDPEGVDAESRVYRLESEGFDVIAAPKRKSLMDGIDSARKWLKKCYYTRLGAEGLDRLAQVTFAYDEKQEVLLERLAPSKHNISELAFRMGMTTPRISVDDDDLPQPDTAWVV